MRKKKIIKKHPVKPDEKYSSPVVTKLINKVMKDGEKRKAKKIVYRAAEIVEKKISLPFLTVLKGAVENAKIGIEMKRIKIGGGNYRVPKPIEEGRDEKKVLSSIVKVAGEKVSAKTMPEKLAEIIIDTNNKVGEVIKKKENVLKEGVANASFASFLNRK